MTGRQRRAPVQRVSDDFGLHSSRVRDNFYLVTQLKEMYMSKLLVAAQRPMRQLTDNEVEKITGADSGYPSIGEGTWDWIDTHGTGGAPRQDYKRVD
jgi:hypothetical protein